MQGTAPTKLPPPASRIALTALREMGLLARSVDQMLSSVVHTVFGEVTLGSHKLQDMMVPGGKSEEFSAVFYETMKIVLSHLGASRALVSQSAGRKAFGQVTLRDAPEQFAAQLALQLLREEPVRIDYLDAHSPVSKETVAQVAVFSVLLYLLSDRESGDYAKMIQAATALATALQDEILQAFRTQNGAVLSSLFARYAAHV
ncbi:hypothetical protein J2Z31_005278 [Sinorhizobium kostiense]|uniref:Uncharacterized protein n=1 Tax=Sinorhizobium kostiense TaxID=76747 RepID=A0ABS4R772_9HYPH|nr:hypothetical protein [Sinorhizobium kostiense]